MSILDHFTPPVGYTRLDGEAIIQPGDIVADLEGKWTGPLPTEWGGIGLTVAEYISAGQASSFARPTVVAEGTVVGVVRAPDGHFLLGGGDTFQPGDIILQHSGTWQGPLPENWDGIGRFIREYTTGNAPALRAAARPNPR